MATFTFDGTTSITATKNDTVLVSADPTTFTQATDNGSSVTLAFGTQTVTITGTTLAAGNLPNVFVTGGTFSYADTVNTNGSGSGNALSILNSINNAAFTTTAASKVAIFGGLGRVDSIDGNDTINIGGKGTFLVFGNGGDDRILQSATAFDSTSTVNVFADEGNDSITLTNAANKASIFVGGGAGLDTINIINAGTTTIYGGNDSTDGADRIDFEGFNTSAGKSVIFGNGGDDILNVGRISGLDSSSVTTVYGGVGNDSIIAFGVGKATISVLGNEGSDNINVYNFGNTFITGGNESGDQSNDGADRIAFGGSGNVLIFGNAGGDNITARFEGTDTTNISIYGGKGGDTITQTLFQTPGKATIFIAGGEDGDTISAIGNGGGLTIYGGISSSDTADGADRITIANGSTGALNVFADGGADTINLGQFGADSVNTATVYGGVGADSIFVAVQQSTSQALTINLGEGPDSIVIGRGFGQTITISDFNVNEDKLGIIAGNGTSLQITAGSFQTLQQALNAAANTAGTNDKAAAVVFGGSTYVVLNDGVADFQPGADQAIKLTGVTDLVGLVGATLVSV